MLPSIDLARRRCLALAVGAGGLALPMRRVGAQPASAPAASTAAAASLVDVLRTSAAAAPLTHGVAVERHGNLVAEAYFTADDKPSGTWIARTVAFDAAALHDMRSVSKSVTALLAGVAHGRGQLDADRPVLDWFPEHAALATAELRTLRLAHLLTMTAGLEWDETSLSYADPFNSETRMGRADDPVAFVLSRPMAAPPGSRFVYSGGATLLLGAIVERATGRPLDVLAREALFEPLAIERSEWRHHPRWKRPLAFSGLRLAPRAMLKLGRLVLDDGRQGGRVLIPAPWLHELQRPIVDATGGLRYGYQWWVGRIASGRAQGTDWVAGLGNGGQVLMVVPRLDAVVAVTAGRYNERASGTPSLRICRDVIEALLA